MKKKLLGIVVCMLLIAIALLPAVSTKDIVGPKSIIDQEQPNTGDLHWLEPGVANWQQFINRGKTLEKVDLHIGCWFSGSADITLSIEETVGGTPLTSVTYAATDLPLNMQDWFTFDVPDVKLDNYTMYHIVLRFDQGSEYAWSGEVGDPYPAGGSSHPNPDWDFAFRTIVDKSVPVTIQMLFLRFIENHPRMFPLLRLFLGL